MLCCNNRSFYRYIIPLKRKAAETDLPTKHMILIAESVNRMSFETAEQSSTANCSPSEGWHDTPGRLHKTTPLILEPSNSSSSLPTTSAPTPASLYFFGTLATPLGWIVPQRTYLLPRQMESTRCNSSSPSTIKQHSGGSAPRLQQHALLF